MENIYTTLRLRPINEKEKSNGDLQIWNTFNEDTVGITQEMKNELFRLRKFVPGQKTTFQFSIIYIIIIYKYHNS